MNFFLAIFYRIPPGSLFFTFRRWVRQTFKLYLPEDMIIADLASALTTDTLRWFSEAHINDLSLLHHTYGMDIRNTYGLWDFENPHVALRPPKMENGVVTDPKFPDNMSQRIIEKIYFQMHSETEITSKTES